MARGGEFETDAIVARLGFDNLVTSWATFAAELLSEWQVGDNPIVLPGDIVFVAPFERRVASISVPPRDEDLLNLALGFKFNVRNGMVLVTNIMAPLYKTGVQSDIIWTFGIEGSW